jgi:hypothetical protein
MRAPTGGIILVESIHIRRSLVRLPGAKAMAQAEGMAITRAKSVEPSASMTEFMANLR